MHAGDGARDDQALDLTGSFKDRVGIGVPNRFTGQSFFPNYIDPRITGMDPFNSCSGRSRTLFMGRERAPQTRAPIVKVMRNISNDNPAGTASAVSTRSSPAKGGRPIAPGDWYEPNPTILATLISRTMIEARGTT
jgi:hypothetical protein